MRSIAEIYDELLAIKEGRSELDGLTPINDSSAKFLNDNSSGSRVAVWRLWLWLVATGNWLTELIIKRHKEEIAEIFRSRMYGTLQFYQAICLDFQFGYSLEWNGRQYAYSDTDSIMALESKIIKRAAVVQATSQLQFKVAKETDGLIEPLDVDERSAFMSYLTALVYPGTNFVVISEAADDLRIDALIYFDPLILAPNGSMLSDSNVFPVHDAINRFVSNLPFNGRMNTQKLIDAIQAVAGVKDIVVNALDARYGGLPYAAVGNEYVPFAGHMTLQEADSLISYTAYV